jgi:hypothetical protein
MSGPVSVPARRHGREEVRRNLLRLSAYQALLLDPPTSLPSRAVPASPMQCVYQALAVSTLLCARAGAAELSANEQSSAPEYVAYLLALLARIRSPRLPDPEGRAIFLGHLAAALEELPPPAAPLARLHLGLRRRMLELLDRIRGRTIRQTGSSGRAALPPVIEIGVSVYYLGDALEVYRRLTPPGSALSLRTPRRSTPSPPPAIRRAPASSPRSAAGAVGHPGMPARNFG